MVQAAAVPARVALVEAVTAEPATAAAITPEASREAAAGKDLPAGLDLAPAPAPAPDLAMGLQAAAGVDRDLMAEAARQAVDLEVDLQWLGRLVPSMARGLRTEARDPAGRSSADQAVVAELPSIRAQEVSG